jgi:hypothetical protein
MLFTFIIYSSLSFIFHFLTLGLSVLSLASYKLLHAYSDELTEFVKSLKIEQDIESERKAFRNRLDHANDVLILGCIFF